MAITILKNKLLLPILLALSVLQISVSYAVIEFSQDGKQYWNIADMRNHPLIGYYKIFPGFSRKGEAQIVYYDGSNLRSSDSEGDILIQTSPAELNANLEKFETHIKAQTHPYHGLKQGPGGRQLEHRGKEARLPTQTLFERYLEQTRQKVAESGEQLQAYDTEAGGKEYQWHDYLSRNIAEKNKSRKFYLGRIASRRKI